MTATRMGRVQLKIMQVLWEKGRANAREISGALNLDQPTAPCRRCSASWKRKARFATGGWH